MNRSRARLIAPSVLALALSSQVLSAYAGAANSNDKVNGSGSGSADRIVSLGGNNRIKSKGGKDTILSGLALGGQNARTPAPAAASTTPQDALLL